MDFKDRASFSLCGVLNSNKVSQTYAISCFTSSPQRTLDKVAKGEIIFYFIFIIDPDLVQLG